MSASTHEVDDVDRTQACDAAVTMIIDILNRAKDARDAALDAKRAHNGMTLDEYLSQR